MKQAPARAQAVLTMAICSVMADKGLRRSEAAALQWADVRTEADGSGRLAVRDAELGDGFSGHSPRVGMAARMTRRGAPMQVVQRQGRWASPSMAARYNTRNECAGEALRYL